MNRNCLTLLLAVLTLLLTACAQEPVVATASPSSVDAMDGTAQPSAAAEPVAIVEGFFDAYNSGDLDAAMAFVDAGIQCRGHCYLDGAEAFRSFIGPGAEAGDQITVTDLRVDGNAVTFNYEIVSGGIVTARGVDAVMRVENGLIVYYEIN